MVWQFLGLDPSATSTTAAWAMLCALRSRIVAHSMDHLLIAAVCTGLDIRR